MIAFQNYVGREQSYVKHVFLEGYLERLVHKVASAYSHIVYIDGFAGPWQSANEDFQDTSFGIALNALRRSKLSWRERQRNVRMSAFLVERDPTAYRQLAGITPRYPEIAIRTYEADFMAVIGTILNDIPVDAFAFFLIDPKGWRLPLRDLEPLLRRSHSEVIFNFMFDFINRAASIKDPVIVTGLQELIPYGQWRTQLDELEALPGSSADKRRGILVNAFGNSLARLGNYRYVAETTVLRPLADRPLYCLFYATRHPRGIEVFRDCQIAALIEQSSTRAVTRLAHASTGTGQGELFESLHEMAPNELSRFLEGNRNEAEESLLQLAPDPPNFIRYEDLWPQVLARHIVKRSEVNRIAARLRREERLLFPDWETRRQVPQSNYRVQRSAQR
jgi:three-Cys-motif partner protein